MSCRAWSASSIAVGCCAGSFLPTSVMGVRPWSMAHRMTLRLRCSGSGMVPSEISTALKPNICACCMKIRQLLRTIATSNRVPPGYVKTPCEVRYKSLRRNTSVGTKADVPKVHFQWSMRLPHISNRSEVDEIPSPLSMTIVSPLLRGACSRPVSRPSTTCAHASSGITNLLRQFTQGGLDHRQVCSPGYNHDLIVFLDMCLQKAAFQQRWFSSLPRYATRAHLNSRWFIPIKMPVEL